MKNVTVAIRNPNNKYFSIYSKVETTGRWKSVKTLKDEVEVVELFIEVSVAGSLNNGLEKSISAGKVWVPEYDITLVIEEEIVNECNNGRKMCAPQEAPPGNSTLSMENVQNSSISMENARRAVRQILESDVTHELCRLNINTRIKLI